MKLFSTHRIKLKQLRFYVIALLLLSSLSTTAQNIFRTTCQGNYSRLDSLLQKSPIDTLDNRGRSLLHWAVACKQEELFDYLVSNGIDIHLEDHDEETPLHLAVKFDRRLYFEKLLDLESDNDWTTNYGASLLGLAVLDHNTFMVKQLIDKGVDIDATNERGSTALEIANRLGAKDMIHVLDSLGADHKKVRTIELFGDFMGQTDPGLKPQIFANNFISTEESEFGSVFNKDNTEFFYAVDVDRNGKNEIRYSKLMGNKWSQPKTILAHETYGYNDPFLSPDEQRLYFISKRPLDGKGEMKDFDIWYVERLDNAWSEPINAGPHINSTANEYYISFTEDGTMYFSSNVNAPEEREWYDFDIYSSKYINGEFQKAVPLGKPVNTEDYEADVFVDPDEQYLIFCGTKAGGYGRGDLYISFKKEDGTWSKSVNMGDAINTKHHELCPFVTMDGKYLFYTSDQDIYWVSTKIFDKIRNRIK